MVAAGDWARRIYANDDAMRHYERALATLEDCGTGGEERLNVCERLADLLGPSGRRDQALEHYQAILSAFEAAADRPPAQARVLRKMGALQWAAGEREQATARHRAALALLDGEVEHIELAHLYEEMGRIAFRSGEAPGAVEWARRALEQAEKLIAAAGPTTKDEAWRKETATVISYA